MAYESMCGKDQGVGGSNPLTPTMKLINLYLGLKDQMPLRRFIRNLRKGHVLGLFHKRSHLTFEGKPKVSYGSKESATGC